MGIAIGTFVNFRDYKFQNFFQGETVSWENQDYTFAGFGL